MKLAPYQISPAASASGLPCSIVMISEMSSMFSSINRHHPSSKRPPLAAGKGAPGRPGLLGRLDGTSGFLGP